VLKFEESTLSSTGKFNTNDTTRDTQFRNIDLNSNYNFKDSRYLLSKTLESNIGGQKSGEIKFTISTTSKDISPIVDLEKTNMTLVSNQINNDVTGETTPSGGNALAKYITRIMTLEDGQDAEDLKVKLSGYKPLNTNIRVYYKIMNKDDYENFELKNWVEMEQTTVSSVYSSEENSFDYKTFNYAIPNANLTGPNGEVQYTNSIGITYTGYKYIAIKVVLTSTTTGLVPKVSEFMAIALQV